MSRNADDFGLKSHPVLLRSLSDFGFSLFDLRQVKEGECLLRIKRDPTVYLSALLIYFFFPCPLRELSEEVVHAVHLEPAAGGIPLPAAVSH